MYGYIHSIETMGTVDGPGLRYVVFTTGCPLRCKFCHNPDTWLVKNGKKMSSDEILEDYEKYRPYLRNGGLTVSGGDPLVQIDFVSELFEKAKKKEIHTCLDTSGATFNTNPDRIKKFEKLLNVTDLVMLDIKHIEPEGYKTLTGGNLNETLSFLDFLAERTCCEVWIRHVIIKGYTYKTDCLYKLGYYIGGYKNIVALDVLPYHDMAVHKYERLGIEYPLKGVPPMTEEHAKKARAIIEAGMRDKLLGNESKY